MEAIIVANAIPIATITLTAANISNSGDIASADHKTTTRTRHNVARFRHGCIATRGGWGASAWLTRAAACYFSVTPADAAISRIFFRCAWTVGRISLANA